MNALTQRGLSEPLKGFEITLLDASFDYFRHRSVSAMVGTEVENYTTYKISRAWRDCAGCLRLDESEITPADLDALPPPDCQRDTCALSVQPHVDFIKIALDKDRGRYRSAP